MKKFFTSRQWLFLAVFVVLGFLALQVPVTQLVGSKAKFTLFDTLGPIASGFLGTWIGVLAVFLMQLVNFLVDGAHVQDAGTVIHFFPMLFAAWYFSRKSAWNVIIPIAAIIIFNAHPIGRSAWYYSMYWLIPIAMYFLRERFLLARALGATFTAHAVGGAAWIWVFGLPKAVWISLIPVVAIERSIFALGIVVSYVVINNLIHVLAVKKFPSWSALVNEKHLLWHPMR